MFRHKVRRGLALLLAIAVLVSGCAAPAPQVIEKEKIVTQVVKETVIQKEPVEVEKEVTRIVTVTEPAPTAAPRHAKYVFLFIGDGMGVAQRNSAELYLAASQKADARPEETKLLMNTFPAQGMNTTYDLTSVIPDSASTATAISTGFKTKSGVIGMDAEGKVKYENIAETAKAKGWKVGIISTVSLDHATPAAFYAHQPSRGNMYEICMELANSDFDYFAGGQMARPTGKAGDQPSAIEAAQKNGFTVAMGRDELMALEPGVGKVLAMSAEVQDSAAMYYELDRPETETSLAEYVAKGIELLDNPTGFFMMVEGGKIDWACHANDAAASIHDTLAFDAAIAEAYAFYEEHPDDTLIIVTGDHETGGMTIGFAGTQYSAFFDKIQYQKMSYVEFDKQLEAYKETHTLENARFEDMLPAIEEAFGLTVLPADERAAQQEKVEGEGDEAAAATLAMALSDLELEVLQQAFVESMKGEEIRSQDEHTYLLYGGYEPLSIKLTTILNQKAGLGWTSYSHTGVPVQTSAIGVGSELFNGYYDQTDIYRHMMAITGLK